MKEHYVSYSQAVELKRMGFDWKVDRSYTDVIKESAREEWDEEECQWSTVYDCNIYPKPRLDQVAAWLREEKGIDIEVVTILNQFNKTKYYKANLCYFDKDERGEDYANYKIACLNINSYENALSIGIDKALELLGKEVNNEGKGN